jgi:hypothetical protein
MMTTVSRRKPPSGRGLTYEKVWAMMQETDRQIKENERKWQETQAKMEAKREAEREEADRHFRETERLMKESAEKTDRIVGDLSNRFGEMVEHLVAPSIHERFNELGYHFDAFAPGGYVIRDENKNVIAEVDILLENAEYIMAVEVKAKVLLKDIEHHIKRIEILREYRNKRHDSRKIQGAIAGAIFGSAEKQATLEAGFYVIEQTGDTVRINVPEDFKAREW